MKNYKLVEVLKTFDKKEMKRYGELVHSPYFNKNKNVRKLFDELKKYHPDFDEKKIVAQGIFSNAFPGEEFVKDKLKNLVSDLYALAEKFLTISGIEKKDFTQEFTLLEELRHKGLYNLYENRYGKMLTALEGRKVKDEVYYLDMHNLVSDYMWYTPVNTPNTGLENHQKYLDTMIDHSLIKFVKSYSLMLHEQNQTNISYNLTMIDQVMEHLKDREVNNPTLLIFYKVTLLLRTKDLKVYTELKELKDKYIDELHIFSQRRLFIHLYDFCAYMVNFKGDDSYNKDMFEIYKEVLQRKFMTADNLLFPDFINIVKIACRVKEISFAQTFIQNYKSSIPKEEITDVLEFCYGVIEYAKENYNKALRHFSLSNFQNFIFRVQVKIFLLQTYYKLKMYEEVLGMADTFRHFIAKEENLLAEHKEAYKIFIKVARDLVLTLSLHDLKEKEYKLHKLKKEAQTIPSNPFRIKVWLLEELSMIS